MWQLQQQWDQHRTKLAELEKQKREGMHISDERLNAARRQVELDQTNAASIAAAQDAQQKTVAAEAAKWKAQQAARGKEHEQQLLTSARLRFQGSDEAWEAVKGDVLNDLLRREALGEPLPSAVTGGPRIAL